MTRTEILTAIETAIATIATATFGAENAAVLEGFSIDSMTAADACDDAELAACVEELILD